jgi:20S proteasome alpha/beta subunit
VRENRIRFYSEAFGNWRSYRDGVSKDNKSLTMSIVICAVDKNRKFYIASDLRAIQNGVIRDDYEKVCELRPHVYYGMTGIAEAGLELLEKVREYVDLPVADLISKVDERFRPSPTMLTIMLAGQDEDGNYFIWQKNNEGEIRQAAVNDRGIAYSIAAHERIGEFMEHFEHLVRSGMSLEKAVAKTMAFASEIDKTISPKYRMIKLEK